MSLSRPMILFECCSNICFQVSPRQRGRVDDQGTHRVISRQAFCRRELEVVRSAKNLFGLFQSIFNLACCEQCSSRSILDNLGSYHDAQVGHLLYAQCCLDALTGTCESTRLRYCMSVRAFAIVSKVVWLIDANCVQVQCLPDAIDP